MRIGKFQRSSHISFVFPFFVLAFIQIITTIGCSALSWPQKLPKLKSQATQPLIISHIGIAYILSRKMRFADLVAKETMDRILIWFAGWPHICDKLHRSQSFVVIQKTVGHMPIRVPDEILKSVRTQIENATDSLGGEGMVVRAVVLICTLMWIVVIFAWSRDWLKIDQ